MPVEKKYLHNIDLVNNRLLNPIINPLTTAQRTTLAGLLTFSDEGYLAYDTTLNAFYFWDGTAWQQVASGGGAVWGSITGTITAQTDLITYLSANYYPLSSNPAGYLTSSSIAGMVTGSGTATRIAFWDTGSSISSDADLYWDNTNKYLGIGTSTPSYPLHVDGAGYINGDLTISSPNYLNLSFVKLGGSINAFGLDYATFEATTGNNGIAIVAKANGNPIGYGYAFQFQANQVANQLLFVGDNQTQAHYIHTDASPGGNGWPLIFGVAPAGQNWNTSSNLLVLTASQNVGIGTISPSYKLDITGTFHTTGQNTLDNLAGSGTRMVVADAAGLLSTQTIPVVPTNTVTGTGTATRVAFWDSSSSISSDSALYWDNSNKRLGIGTSTPGYSFETTGKGYFGDNVGIQTTPDNTYRLKLGNGGSMLISSGGSPYIDFNTVGTGNNTWRTENQFDTGAFNILETGASTIAFKAIKTSGNVIIGGSSSSTTSYKLDVLGNQSITGYLNFKPTGAPTQIKIGSADNIVGGTSTSANLVLIGQYAGQALSHATSNDSLIGIGYNAGGSMTSGGTYSIHIGRNSGIGITTGTFNTHIGTTNSTTLPAATSNTIHILGGGGYDLDNAGLTLGSLTSRYALIGGGYNGAYYINDFYFGAGPFISDPANANLSFYAPSARGTDLVGPNFTINAGRGTGTGTPGDILFTTSTATSTGTTVQTLSSRMVIKGETGVVGIGTTTPNSTYKLHVVGSIATTTGINVDPTVSSKTGVYGGPNTITFWAGNNQLSTYTLVGNSPGSHFTHNLPFNNNIGTGVQNAWRIASDVVATGVNSINHVQLRIDPLYAHGVLGLGTVRGIYYDPTVASLNGADHIAWENTSGDIIHGNLATGGADEMVTVDTNGKLKKQAIPGGGGGLTRSINTVSGNTSAGAAANTDYYYFVSALATITLPTAVGNTNEYTIKRTGSGVVTIDTTSSQTIDGSLTIALNVVNQSVTLISDGANWQII